MANIYTPERLSGESFKAYRERRSNAKKFVEQITLTGAFQPGKQSSRQAHRDAMRSSGSMAKNAGAYGRGLRNWIVDLNRAAQAQRLAKRMTAFALQPQQQAA